MPMPEFLDPKYPPINLVNEPVIQGVPLVDPNEGYFKQMAHWFLFKRKRYLVKEDYFTYCPYLSAWIGIPKNTGYDGASVPRFPFGVFLRPNGILFYGSLPHDFGVRFGGMFLSQGVGKPYTFVSMSKEKIDFVFDNLNQKASKLRFVTGFCWWILTVIGDGPTGMKVEDQDWSQPVWRI